MLVMGLILAGGMVWLSGRSRYVPYVVEVDRLGYGMTVAHPLTAASVPDVTARMERYEVASFICEAREVSSDSQVEQQQLNSLLAHARGAADRFLDEYYHADTTHNPFRLCRSKPFLSKSIRSFNFRRKATRCGGLRRREI
jgi:type IV secretory pathway TrbF-like protein